MEKTKPITTIRSKKNPFDLTRSTLQPSCFSLENNLQRHFQNLFLMSSLNVVMTYLIAIIMGTIAYGTFRKVQNVGACLPVATPNRRTIIELNNALTQ